MYARHHAFNLIELLVALSIVGLIAAILYPVFARVRAKAQQHTCRTQLRQIGLATLQYAQDWDERLPGQSVGALNWQQVLKAQYPALSFVCPTSRVTSYGCNGIGDICTDYRREAGCHLASIVDPSQTVWCVDGYDGRTVMNVWGTAGTINGMPYVSASTPNSGMVARHFGLVQTLWCDGHVSVRSLGQMGERDKGGALRLWTRAND